MTTHPLELRLFAVARGVVAGAAVLALLGAASSLIEVLTLPTVRTAVTFADVERAAAPQAAPSTSPNDLPWTPRIKAALPEGQESLLRGWLEAVPERDRAAFLAELDAVLLAATTSKVPTKDLVNTWHQLKMEKLAAAAVAGPVEDFRRVASLLSALGFGALAVLLSMALVLLAIERNTRPREVATPADPPAGEDDVVLVPVRRQQGDRALR